jgi:WD40 repeat protein
VVAIFISHSSRDNRMAGEVKAWLSGRGYEHAFLDFDKDGGLGAGSDWERQLYEAIARCHAVILIVTPAWLESKWCFAEFTQARALGKVIFPLVLTPEDLKLIGPSIQTIQTELWDSTGQDHLDQRLKVVADEIARGHRWDQSRSPWPGILAFEAEDAAVFFGRDPEIRKVGELLEARRTQGGPKLLLLVGASGSGKSSLLKAGVVPYVGRDKRRFLSLPPFRPGQTPLTELAKVLAEAIGRPEDFRSIRSELDGDDPRAALLHIIEGLTIGAAREARVLVAIDQFEEIFTIAGPERPSFLKLLALATQRTNPLPLLVVATVRSDLLGEILKHEDFAIEHDVFTLGPLPAERLPSVIEGPAQIAAIRLEEGLVARILDDVDATTEALPLLAFTLRELNERYGADKKLTLVEYEALGDPGQRLRPLENAVRRKAEETLQTANPSPAELAALKEAFVGQLVRVNEEGIRLRRPARIADIPSSAKRLIDALVGARLLSTRTEGDAPAVEVAHEALFRSWPLLASWLDAEQDFLIGRRQIEEAERLWASAPERQRDKALLTGLLLEKAREWSVAYPERLRGVSPFVLASIRKDDSEQLRARRRLRILTIASAAATLVFVALGLFAGYQSYRAQAERLAAEAAQDVALRESQIAETERGRALEAEREAESLAEEARRLASAAEAAHDDAQRQSQMALAERARALEAEHEADLAAEDAKRQSEIAKVAAAMAEQEGRAAAVAAAEAKAQRDAALRTQSLFLADLSHQQIEANDPTAAVGLALEALPDHRRGVVRPYVPEAEKQLFAALSVMREKRFLGLEAITSAVFAPDSERVATTSGVVTKVWDWKTGQVIQTLLGGHTGNITKAIFSPDGKLIATASADGTAVVWNLDDGSRLVLRGHTSTVNQVAFSPDGKLLATASEDSTARIWDAENGKERTLLTGWEYSARSITFSHDGSKVAVTLSGSIEVWSVAAGAKLTVMQAKPMPNPRMFPPAPNAAIFSLDDRLILSSLSDGTARLWDAVTGAFVADLGGPPEVEGPYSIPPLVTDAAVFLGDGKLVMTTGPNSTRRLWDIQTGKEIATFPVRGEVAGQSAVSPDGKWLVTSSAYGGAWVWQLDAPLVISVLGAEAANPPDATYAPDVRYAPGGDHILTASTNGTAQLWSRSGLERTLDQGSSVISISFSSAGDRIVTTGGRKAHLWEVSTGKKVGEFASEGGFIAEAAVSPDGTLLALVAEDHSIRIVNVSDGAERTTIRGVDYATFRSVQFSPDGQRLVTGTDAWAAQLWDVKTGRELAAFPPDANEYDPATNAVYSPDGTRIATASWYGTVRIWQADPIALQLVLQGPSEPVLSIRFSKDSRRVVCVYQDNTASIWDVSTGSQLAVIDGREDGLVAADFSPDGSRIVTASTDGRFRILQAFPTTQDLVDYARSVMPRELSPEQRTQFFLD